MISASEDLVAEVRRNRRRRRKICTTDLVLAASKFTR